MERSSAKRVVLDTNVVVSALRYTGAVSWLRASWQAEIFKPLISSATVGELIRVLHYPKFGLDEEQVQVLLAEYLPYCAVVKSRDVADHAFLQLALAGRADFLVTGDKDLHAVADRVAFQIVSPGASRSLIGSLSEKLARYVVRERSRPRVAHGVAGQ